MITNSEQWAKEPTPAAPRWRVHVEIDTDSGQPDVLEFRASLDERLLQLPPWRAGVVTAEYNLIALTFSAFGNDYEATMRDAQHVLADFHIPRSSMWIELTSPEQIERRRRSPLPHLLGVKEMADLLGYSRQRISQLAREPGPFPKPISRVGATPLWIADEVEEWLDGHRVRGTTPASSAGAVPPSSIGRKKQGRSVR